jgi:predicted acylesterase/phospholipase RssA
MRKLAGATVPILVLVLLTMTSIPALAGSPCDARKVAKLVQAKRATAAQLADACTLPAHLRGLLDVLDTTTEQGQDEFVARIVAGGAFIEPVCPDYKDVFRDMAFVHPTRRSHHVFTGCNLAKTGFFAQPSTNERDVLGMLGPPLLERWLASAGEPRARALAEAFSVVAAPSAGVGTSEGSPAPAESATAQPTEAQVDTPLPRLVAGAGPASRVAPLALTISGAVSLGAYEAGFLYYLSEFLKLNPHSAELKVVTGASAGSLNGFITLLSQCAGEPESPRDSLFWSTWAEIGFDNLFVPSDTTPTGAFSRAAFEKTIERVQERWNAGLPETCDVVFGVTTTRLIPHPISVRGDLVTLPRTREKFVVRIQGQGMGKAPRLSNYTVPQKGLDQAILPLDDPLLDPFESLEAIIKASTAFPLAFAPQPVTHCMISPEADGVANLPKCTLSSSRTDLFIDGAVFDNQPLGVAAQAVTRGLEPVPGTWKWRDAPDLTRPDLAPEVLFISLDPGVQAWPAARPVKDAAPTDSLFAMSAHLFGSLVSSARSEELQDLLAEHPSLRDRLLMGQNHLPHASGLLGAFFGFFERGFREFDFYVGMLDARFLVEEQFNAVAARDAYRLPEPKWDGDAGSVDDAWRPYFCLRGVLANDDALLAACAGAAREDIRILAQSSMDRLYDYCQGLAKETPVPIIYHRQCRRAAQGSSPPRLVPLPADQPKAWKKEEGEEPYEHMLRLLGLYKFHFRDLGLKRGEADQAGARIHGRIIRLGDQLAEVHEDGGAVITTLARRGANAIEYVPAPELLYINLGTSPEIGWSTTRPWNESANWLRLHAALTFEGLPALQSSIEGDVSFILTTGLVLEPVWLNGGSFQLRFGARAGVLLSPTDSVFFGKCSAEQTGDSATVCSRLATQGFVSLSLFDRVRIQLGATWLPPVRPDARSYISVDPSVGIQFYGPFFGD